MSQLRDLFKQDIHVGDVVAYSTRGGSKQLVNFAIVVDTEPSVTTNRDMLIRALDPTWFKMNMYKLKPTATGSFSTQVWVVPTPEILPLDLVKALEKGLETYLIQEQRRKEDEFKAPTEKLSAGERYRRNVRKLIEEDKRASILGV